jgi:hypothetical protein
MGGRDHVGRKEGPARTYGRSLLTGREMDESWYLTVAIEPGYSILEASNQQHSTVHLHEVVVRELGDGWLVGVHGPVVY